MTDDGIQVWAPMEVVEGLLARAEKAEAAIRRVREVCGVTVKVEGDPSWQHGWDQAMKSVLRALDGDGGCDE